METGLPPFSAYRTRSLDGNSYVDGLAVSGTTTYRGDMTNKARLVNPSYQFIWTGTPTGTLTIWVSDKPEPDPATDTDWTLLTLAIPIVQPAGTAGNEFVDLGGLPSRWMRPRYVNASGSGTLFGWVAGMG